jgi:hypothetical protein
MKNLPQGRRSQIRDEILVSFLLSLSFFDCEPLVRYDFAVKISLTRGFTGFLVKEIPMRLSWAIPVIKDF